MDTPMPQDCEQALQAVVSLLHLFPFGSGLGSRSKMIKVYKQCLQSIMMQYRYLIPALNELASYTTAHPIVTQFLVHGRTDDLTTERSFDSQATGSLMCLAYFFDMGVCTTRHWQTSGRLVQQFNVCTVFSPQKCWAF